MKAALINSFILTGGFAMIFLIAEFMYHRLKVKAELTRKFVHFATGVLSLLFPVLMTNHWMVLLVCSLFGAFLALSLKYNLLPSINNIDRKSVGTIMYPISVYGCYLGYKLFDSEYIYFYLPILILAICDPIATLFGKRWPRGRYRVGLEYKTWMGTSAFFISAMIVSYALFMIFYPGLPVNDLILYSLIISTVTAIAEACSGKGFDNVSIPAAALVGMIIIQGTG